MSETVAASPDLIKALIEVIPYAGATLLMLIIVFVFIRWMMKQQEKRDEILVDIVRENTSAQIALRGSVEHLIQFCHMKNVKCAAASGVTIEPMPGAGDPTERTDGDDENPG